MIFRGCMIAHVMALWELEDFEDDETGECHTVKDWAEYFATDRSIELYVKLAEAKREIINFKRILHRE